MKSIAGESLYKILQIQMINTARKLLNTDNVFSFLQIESQKIDKIKAESCFRANRSLFHWYKKNDTEKRQDMFFWQRLLIVLRAIYSDQRII